MKLYSTAMKRLGYLFNLPLDSEVNQLLILKKLEDQLTPCIYSAYTSAITIEEVSYT